jgi:hypothetical protein
MKNRVWALVQVGKYVGIDAMLAQVKAEEKEALKTYLRRFFLNNHGVNQTMEMKASQYVQEGAELGYKYLTALRDSLY